MDNLSATSSPIQRVLKDLRPGDNEAVINQNEEAFREVCGPILAAQLGDREYMFGDSFTAIDVAIGYSMIGVQEKRDSFLKDFPTLRRYADRLKRRPAYLKAIGEGD